MARHRLRREQVIELPLAEVFEFFSSARNLQKVTPAALRFEFLEEPPAEVEVGSLIRYRLRIGGIPVKWVTRIAEWDPPHRFADDQASGPYAYWHHVHSFRELEPGRTLMTDEVDYEVPLGPLGEIARVVFVDRQLAQVFGYRQRAFAAILEGAPAPDSPHAMSALALPVGAGVAALAALLGGARYLRRRR